MAEPKENRTLFKWTSVMNKEYITKAASASYGRTAPTSPGGGPMDRIQAGTRALLWGGLLNRIDIKERVVRYRVGIWMIREIQRYTDQPFCEALGSFNKKAKKFRKPL